MSNEDLIKTIYDIEEMVETDPEDNRREILHRLIEVRADIARLRSLVQGQKELIALHEKLGETDFLTKKEWMRMDVLCHEIKELEK